jgi:hypothetical protein
MSTRSALGAQADCSAKFYRPGKAEASSSLSCSHSLSCKCSFSPTNRSFSPRLTSERQREQHPQHLLGRPLDAGPRPTVRDGPPLLLGLPRVRDLHRRGRRRPRTLLRDPVQLPEHSQLLDGVLHRHRRRGALYFSEEERQVGRVQPGRLGYTESVSGRCCCCCDQFSGEILSFY